MNGTDSEQRRRVDLALSCNTRRRGMTIVEVAVSLICAAAMGTGIAVTAGAMHSDDPAAARLSSKSLRDAAHLRQIHGGFITFAQRYRPGHYPIPGRVRRLPVENGTNDGGENAEGPEDVTQNTTANIFSLLVMGRYYPPRLLISPIERNPKVRELEGYRYDVFDPESNTYWDDAFTADLETGSHVSYAHMPIFGERVERHWWHTGDSTSAVLGNRGPREGRLDPASHTCGPHGHWSGHVVFNDNHVEMRRETGPESLTFDRNDESHRDNLFRFDDGVAGVDRILTFTKAMTDEGPTVQFD